MSVREHTVFFRPAVEDNPSTNVTIVTDKHTYSLYLTEVSSIRHTFCDMIIL
ncbi:TrbG/VirB9 family P-type conjugative transfer protein [Escherichia coli]|uniref:TrbG/VirB9 family P-type conjugative transfer protein n=1 Tax=Escherichia coli TaxID=562 RepID=UPI002075916F|nr:TrbG/VirB9 family P-type conjugative transfer protein [Escherichia coli]